MYIKFFIRAYQDRLKCTVIYTTDSPNYINLSLSITNNNLIHVTSNLIVRDLRCVPLKLQPRLIRFRGIFISFTVCDIIYRRSIYRSLLISHRTVCAASGAARRNAVDDARTGD